MCPCLRNYKIIGDLISRCRHAGNINAHILLRKISIGTWIFTDILSRGRFRFLDATKISPSLTSMKPASIMEPWKYSKESENYREL